MHIQLKAPCLPTRLILESPLSDDEFECLSMNNDFMHLERSKGGEIVLNAPARRIIGSASSEVTYQLRNWWKTHKRGLAMGSSCGFFLTGTSSYSPDAAYTTAEQLSNLTSRQMERFLRLCPAFVIELLSQRPPQGRRSQDARLDHQRCRTRLAHRPLQEVRHHL